MERRESIVVCGERDRDAHVLAGRFGDEVGETGIVQDTHAAPRERAIPRERHDGHTHPQRVTSRRGAGVGIGVERDVGTPIECEIMGKRLARNEFDSFFGDVARSEKSAQLSDTLRMLRRKQNQARLRQRVQDLSP